MLIFETAINGVSATALQRFAHKAQALTKVRGEVDILISGNKRLQELNRRFRRKNKPTDVLSFPRIQGGDIAISVDIARKNATLYSHAIAEELKILVLHGMLHLAGYDHETDNGRMARVEARLRAQLKLPASLIDRTHSGGLTSTTANGKPHKSRSAAKIHAAEKTERNRKAIKPIRRPSASRIAQ